MSPFDPLNKKFLTQAKAADLLGISARTIKRWLRRSEARGALSAVRRDRQWRIEFEGDLQTWASNTYRRLQRAGVVRWETGYRKFCRESASAGFESYRLWLATYIKALEKGRVTQKGRENMLLLWLTACRVLDCSKRIKRYELDVEKRKGAFLQNLRERGLPFRKIMRYWPLRCHFEIMGRAHTTSDLEEIRRELDFWQAYRDELRRNRGVEPKPKRLCLVLHINLTRHINDTREKLPACVVDCRKPQDGISLRTFRTRYPRPSQQRIIAKIRRLSMLAGVED